VACDDADSNVQPFGDEPVQGDPPRNPMQISFLRVAVPRGEKLRPAVLRLAQQSYRCVGFAGCNERVVLPL